MRRISMALALVLAVTVVSAASAAEALRYKFAEGDDLTYELRVVNEGSSTLPGGKAHNFSFESKSIVQLRCLAATGDTYKLSVKVVKAAVTQDGALKSSPKPQERVVTIDGTGRVVGGAEGADEVLTVLPARPLAVGQSFEGKAGTGGELTTRTTYTLVSDTENARGARGPVARFKAVTAVTGTDKEAVRTSSEGGLWFDLGAGRLLRQERKLNIESRQEIDLGGKPETMVIKQRFVMRQRLIPSR